MSRPIIRIHDTQTDKVIDREMTVAEFNVYKSEQDTENEKQLAKQIDEQTKASAKKLILDRIGLTVDELKTILG